MDADFVFKALADASRRRLLDTLHERSGLLICEVRGELLRLPFRFRALETLAVPVGPGRKRRGVNLRFEPTGATMSTGGGSGG